MSVDSVTVETDFVLVNPETKQKNVCESRTGVIKKVLEKLYW